MPTRMYEERVMISARINDVGCLTIVVVGEAQTTAIWNAHHGDIKPDRGIRLNITTCRSGSPQKRLSEARMPEGATSVASNRSVMRKVLYVIGLQTITRDPEEWRTGPDALMYK